MANRTFYPSMSYGFARVYCEFQFVANGASAPALTTVDGADVVSALSHTAATNVVGVTLKDAFNKVIAHAVDLRDDAAAGAYATLGTFANEATSSGLTFNVNYFNAAGTARNNPTDKTLVTLALRNSASGMK